MRDMHIMILYKQEMHLLLVACDELRILLREPGNKSTPSEGVSAAMAWHWSGELCTWLFPEDDVLLSLSVLARIDAEDTTSCVGVCERVRELERDT